MDPGIFERVFPRPTLGESLDALSAYGLTAVQFDPSSAGLPNVSDSGPISDENPYVLGAERVRQEFVSRGIDIAAVSGTFNIIHPDSTIVRTGLQRLRQLAAACPALGTAIITLSTGTCDAANMWRHHPDNQSEASWNAAVRSMVEIATIGDEFQVTMAFEPEVNNVVDSAQRARRILDEIGSPWIKIVMDGANIFHTGELPRMAEILDEAFDLLGSDIVLAHGKDLDHDGDAGQLPAGQGLLDYDRYLGLLSQSGYSGPLILHGLTEQQVGGCVTFIQARLTSLRNIVQFPVSLG